MVTIPAHRGQIVDRHGEPFAVSTPVSSIWLNPKELVGRMNRLPELAKVLLTDVKSLQKKVEENQNREFVYLKRHASPELAKK